jgi:hypothetical protein
MNSFHMGFVLAGSIFLLSCQSPTRYEWGSYEDSVYNVTANAGEVDLSAEIQGIQDTMARAVDRGKQVPPGLHAHLGLLYSLAGDTGNATAAFLTEKTLYPESAVFMDGMLARAQRTR